MAEVLLKARVMIRLREGTSLNVRVRERMGMAMRMVFGGGVATGTCGG